ncbi:Thiopurine S-methyltransferase (TPMT) [Geosmithia morbida]|uniref:Thiopurine S-methyltransferase (TPMT) n=1 Tax=Geosmithia morbida TaxID=1094350 RepID=A0A9P4Z437_9HYPO|nr:Thiopurine S-methyltransferase (TPMT) [Geosmithia morbida]KAF4126269.1 Thiopurine S-methyltransferase (TPMT) [Geosmithia morbida]
MSDSTLVQEVFAAPGPTPPGDRWDGLYRSGHYSWDRDGPSLALADLLVQRRDLIPHRTIEAQNHGAADDGSSPPTRPTALVPGCGRGHDVLLLAEFGYDVWGLDLSPTAIELARGVEKEKEKEREGGGRGKPYGTVHWLVADFFDDEWSGGRTFDLIFDYTFLCALPVATRPLWASRISSLLSPRSGRLICLEFPSGQPLSRPGPPFGVNPEVYEALLACPGDEVEYDAAGDGTVVERPSAQPPRDLGGVHRLALIKPIRTHKAGMADDGSVRDFVSVWSK